MCSYLALEATQYGIRACESIRQHACVPIAFRDNMVYVIYHCCASCLQIYPNILAESPAQVEELYSQHDRGARQADKGTLGLHKMSEGLSCHLIGSDN